MLEELCLAADGDGGKEVLRSQLRHLNTQLGMGKKHLLLHASTYMVGLEINYIKDHSVGTKPED